MEIQQFQFCIDECNSCAVACDHCASSCLGEKDVKAMARCIQLDIDCAEICPPPSLRLYMRTQRLLI